MKYLLVALPLAAMAGDATNANLPIDIAEVGKLVYSDRAHEFTAVPADGLKYFRGRNDNKETQQVTFTWSGGPVMVAVDGRGIVPEGYVPHETQGLSTTDEAVWTMYVRDYPAGDVTIPPMCAVGNCTAGIVMYGDSTPVELFNGTATLTWNHDYLTNDGKPTDVLGYGVQHRPQGGAWAGVRDVLDNDTGALATQFALPEQVRIVDGTTSCFRVDAYNAAGRSAFSDEACKLFENVDVVLVPVPEVVGMQLADAQEAITASNLVVGTVTEEESVRPVGEVLAQAPAAGAEVDAGTPVNLTVAKAVQPTVPQTVGLTLADAEAAITAAGLVVGAVTEVTSDEPAGTVLAQSPEAGTKAPAGSAVDLVVAISQVTPPRDVTIYVPEQGMTIRLKIE